jgi:hypothetical protein
MSSQEVFLAHDFDPGYGSEPFRTLCGDYPDIALYPTADSALSGDLYFIAAASMALPASLSSGKIPLSTKQ